MSSRTNSIIGFIIKTIILFGFIYEFVPFFMPSTFLSSRKIGFIIALAYFCFKRYSIRQLFKDIRIHSLFIVTGLCVVYSLLLLQIVIGNGEPMYVFLVFFFIYALVGPFVFAGLFDWDFERLLKAITYVTLFQAIWSILTYYIDGFRILNSVLFVIGENENIDFLDLNRLRSIGAAGSGLSVYLAFSSFAYMYFIIKGKGVLFNSISLVVSLFATLLAGTTGLIIFTVSIPTTLYLVTKGRRKGLISAVSLFIVIAFLYGKMGTFLSPDQYYLLTRKYTSLVQNRADDSTVRALTTEQEISGINITTVIGTGLSRGRVSTGELCNHDGGYYRTYFGLGLIMAIVFYLVLFKAMFRLAKRVSKPTHSLLLIYILMCAVVEFKEPFFFSYVPLFVFIILYFAERKLVVIKR